MFKKTLIMFFILVFALLQNAFFADNKALAVRRAQEAGLGNTQKNWLVAIGVNQYNDDKLSPLQFSVNDARAVHEFFQSIGFVPESQSYLVITGASEKNLRPTRNNILTIIKYVSDNAGKDSTIIIHFSGHGFVDDKKRSYFMPEDGRVSLLEDTAVPVGRVNEMLRDSDSSRKILFVDACRNAPFRSGKGQKETDTRIFLASLGG